MDYIKFIQGVKSGTVSRRAFNEVLASLGLATVTVPLLNKSSMAASGNLEVFEWAGYEVPQLYQPYLKKYGKKPNFTFFAGEDEELAKLRAGFSSDITHPCSDYTKMFVDAGVALPIDTSRLSNWPDVFPYLQDHEGVKVYDKVYMVPADWGNSSYTYRTDLVDIKPEEESWSLMFDEKYKGRLAGRDDWGDIMAAALLAGYSADQLFTLSDTDLAKVHTILAKQMKLLRFLWTDETQAQQALASGEVVAAWTWNDAAGSLRKQGVPVRFAHPKEGIFTWLCGLTRVKGGSAPEQQVYDFLDAWLSPATGHYLITEYSYGHSNKKSFATVTDEQLKTAGLPRDPEQMFESSIVWRPMGPKYMKSYINLWNDVKASA